jgi:riboflavin synthase
MFTGLVSGVGEVIRVRIRQGIRELTIRSPFPPEDLRPGASIAVHGVCLTLVAQGSADGVFRVEAGKETLHRTVLGRIRVGDRVHLERALRADDRLGGHLVQGHVDGIGKIRRRGRAGGEWVLEIGIPPRMRRYVVEKGSICVDGVSLTVGRTGPGWFRVHIIPATAAATRLTDYRVGRPVNIEVDLLAKYVESLAGPLVRLPDSRGESDVE